MKKRITHYLLVASLLVIGAGSFVSCKDEDDNAVLTESIAKNASLIEGLQQQLTQLQAAQALCKQECSAQAESLITARIAVVNDVLNSQSKRMDDIVKTIADNNTAVLDAYNTLKKQVAANTDSISSNADKIEDLKNIVLGYDEKFTDLYQRAAANEATAADAKALADSATTLAQQALANASAVDTKVNTLVETFTTVFTELQGQVADLTNRVDAIEKALKLQVTGITVNGTYSPLIGYYAVPSGDVRSTILAAYYGTAADFQFPTANAGYYADDRSMLSYEDLEVTGVSPVTGGGLIVTEDGADGNAGTLYLTLNPTEVDLSGKTFSLVNSQGEESAVTLSEVKASDKVLTFGYTRAAAANGFYEAKATVTADKALSVQPAITQANVKAIAQEVSNLWQAGQTVNVTKIASLLYASVNNVLPALALQTTWNDGTNDHTVRSQYSVAATAVKPLSFGFLKDLNVKLPTLTALDQVSSTTVTTDGVKFTLTDESGNTYVLTSTELDEYLDKLNSDFTNLGNNTIDRANDYITQLNNLSTRLSGYINKFNLLLQPVVLIEKSGMFYLPSTVPYATDAIASGSTIYLTSYTAELLAPAYKKWAAVTNVWNSTADAVKDKNGETVASAQNGDASLKAALQQANSGTNMNKVVFGSVRTGTLGTLESGKVYEIAISAVDYTGKVAARKFYVRGK
jgi:hypothetical protein